jgi:hypothetical protein
VNPETLFTAERSIAAQLHNPYLRKVILSADLVDVVRGGRNFAEAGRKAWISSRNGLIMVCQPASGVALLSAACRTDFRS